MKQQIGPRVRQAGCQRFLSVVAACALFSACQASESREPVKEPPAASAAPAAQAQATQPLQRSAPTAAAAPTAVAAPANPTPAAAAQNTAVPVHTVSAADAPKGADGKAPAASAGAAKPVQGAVVTEEAFSAWLQAASPAKAGAPVQLEAVLVAKAPYHCNPEYPHKFKFSAAPAGVSYPEETVKSMKVTPERSVLAIPVNAQAAGKPTIAGTLSFSVCTEERCMVEKRDLSLALEVM